MMAAPITLWPWVLGARATSAYARMFECGRACPACRDMPGMLQLCFNKNVSSLLWNDEHDWACQDSTSKTTENKHKAKPKQDIWTESVLDKWWRIDIDIDRFKLPGSLGRPRPSTSTPTAPNPGREIWTSTQEVKCQSDVKYVLFLK